ncbi:MAG TPA: hypothetical protein VHD36_23475 [Pirellulales bacterium]|nr:hypothetical protein [Pirellulales bacterium]
MLSWLPVALWGAAALTLRLTAEDLANAGELRPIRLDALRERYRAKDATFHRLEVQWKEDVVDRHNGAHASWSGKWRVLMEGDKLRMEETKGEDTQVLTFNGEVGMRLSTSKRFDPVAHIDRRDVTETLNANNCNTDPVLCAFRPTKILGSLEAGRSSGWASKSGELNGQNVYVLSRGTGIDGTLKRVLYVSPADLTVQRMTDENEHIRIQWDIEYRDVHGETVPMRWKWVTEFPHGKLMMSRTIHAVLVNLNPEIAPSDFEIEFPTRTAVYDARDKDRYIVGPNDEKVRYRLQDLQSKTVDDILNDRLRGRSND